MEEKQTVNVLVDPLNSGEQSSSKLVSKVQKNISDFLESLSYDGFVLAGNSVSNMIENIEIKGDLDFWVTNREKYLNVLEEFKTHNPLTYDIYPSMVLMTFNNLPEVNLILSDCSAEETAKSFDFDYCRCYYTKQKGCVASMECLVSIFTKTINNEICYGDIRPNRILKAVKYGYSFNINFWDFWVYLLKNKKRYDCSICRITTDNYRTSWSQHSKIYKVPRHVSLDDLDLVKFEQQLIDIKISDPNDIDTSINEIEQCFGRYRGMSLRNVNYMIPKLLSLSSDQYDLVREYAKKIVYFNPTRHGNYLDIKFNDKKPYDPFRRLISDEEPIDEDLLVDKPKTKLKKSKTPKVIPKTKSSGKKIKHIKKEKNTSSVQSPTPSLLPVTGEILNYDPTSKDMKKVKIYLNVDKSAYLVITHLPEKLETYGLDYFKEMFDLHPKEKHKIIMYEKEVEVNRYQQSYLKTPLITDDLLKRQSYMYSGYDTTNNQSQLPEHFEVFYNHIKSKNEKYNQVVANWYPSEEESIAFHSDCEVGMIPNAKVALLSLYNDNEAHREEYRILSIIPKNGEVKTTYKQFNIVLRHGIIVTMCGTTQKEFKHGIEKSQTKTMPRIGLSFRQIK
jgi:alkylated DNA repair dioxygenase AlkB